MCNLKRTRARALRDVGEDGIKKMLAFEAKATGHGFDWVLHGARSKSKSGSRSGSGSGAQREVARD